MPHRSTRIAAATLAATLALGGLGGGAVVAGAQEDTGAGAPMRTGVLEELVADGTLTEAQAQAVRERLAERREDGGRGRARHRLARARVTVAAEAIGIEPRDLVARLRDGESIADVAAAEGIDRQAVVDALVAAGTERIDAAEAAGRITEERAIEARDRLPEAAERMVDRTR